ncbi:MAG: XdhC family protein [Pseudomonadales bacterium]
MLNPDFEIFSAVRDSLASSKLTWLCTVIHTFGSSPRPRGSMMVCNSEGLLCGSLSGGCIEDDLIQKLIDADDAFQHFPLISSYGVSAEEGERFGLPCGGRLDVLIEHVTDQHTVAIGQLLTRLENRQCIQRQVDLDTGEWKLSNIEKHGDLSLSDSTMCQVLGPELRLLLIGIGALAEALAEFATPLGYSVTACDPRPEKVDGWPDRLGKAIQGMPDDVVRALVKDDKTAILALSHDPRIDDMGLMEALISPAYYVGALGSTRTAAKRLKRLQALDLPETAIDRLHAPVGLSIGAKTPAEIAIAILAELTQLKRLS